LTAVSAAGIWLRTRCAATLSSKPSREESTSTSRPRSAATVSASSTVRFVKLGTLSDFPATKRVNDSQVAVARTPASNNA
jgi:hypothetical protein